MGSSEGQWEAVGMGDGTFRGPITGSHTSVPGLALSRPYHCTSASSEHSGLLRKQLSLKDLYASELDWGADWQTSSVGELSAVPPLCQLRMCCGLQGGVGVAVCSLDGVILRWLWGDAAGEPLASDPTLLPRPCPRVLCCEPVSEEVDPECEWLLSLRLPEDLWYQHRSSSDTATLPAVPLPPPSRPKDGVRTIWERDGVSRPLPSPPSSPPQASL